MNVFRDITNILLKILPVSGLFPVKRFFVQIMGVNIGKNVSINGHTWFYGKGSITIGSGTWVGVGCRFYAATGTVIEIGENCDIAPEVIFVPGSHIYGTKDRRAGEGYATDIKIGNGCWIGTRVTVLGGVTIGSGVMLAAGAVVQTDIPDNCLAAGVPAVVKKYFDN